MIGNSASEPQDAPVGFNEPPEPAPTILQRVDSLEARLPEMTQIINVIRQQSEAIGKLQQQVVYLAQQRNLVEEQMERHTRATALDLAIKALPESGGAGLRLTTLADAFVSWLKATPTVESDGSRVQ